MTSGLVFASYLPERGESQRAQLLLQEVLKRDYMDHHVAYSLGAAYAQLSNSAEARRWLAEAASTGFPCYPWFVRDPLLRPIRGDPEFQRFMAKLRDGWESARMRYRER